jgi:hypothetical protein
MSGGHFNDCGYVYYKVDNFCDELEIEIQENFIKDDWGYYKGYSDEVIQLLKEQILFLRKAAKIMKHIDYLYSGDYGEETFIERMKE